MTARISFKEITPFEGSRSFLVPLVDGVEIPHVVSCVIRQGVEEATTALIELSLPDGVTVEPAPRKEDKKPDQQFINRTAPK